MIGMTGIQLFGLHARLHLVRRLPTFRMALLNELAVRKDSSLGMYSM